MRTPWVVRGACALLALSTLAGCGSADVIDAAPVFALDRQATTGIAPVDADRTDVLAAPLVRSLLQDLLTEHSDLSIEVMRQAVNGRVDAMSLAELTKNTDELTLTIGVVYGPEGAAAFDQLWTNHIEFFNDYAAARGAGDTDGAEEAVTSLGHYENDFSSYIETATGGEADFHAVLHVLHSHVGQLLDQADAWSDGDYDRAVALAVEAHRHMDLIAAALATGIARQQPDAFPGDVAGATAVACARNQLDASTLQSLLGTLAEAQQRENRDIVDTTRAAVADQRASMPPAVLVVVDRLAGEGAEAISTPSARSATRDVVRARLAVEACAAAIVG